MSAPEVYTNHFDGYTTTFYIWSHRRECVIRWDNTSPIEVVIPYFRELTPDIFMEAIDKLLEKADNIVYEEYPFRGILRSSTESSSTYEIYWEADETNQFYHENHISDPCYLPKVRLFSAGHATSIHHRIIGMQSMMYNFNDIKENLRNIRRTLVY